MVARRGGWGRRLASVLLMMPAVVPLSGQESGTLDTPPVVITGVTVIDVVTGARVPGRAIHIEQGIIRRITDAGAPIPANVRVVDASGTFAIPGLWDMHTHILHRWEWNAPLALSAGVTGIRDLATRRPLAEVLRLRDAVERGQDDGPRIVAFAGPLIDGFPSVFREFLSVRDTAQARTTVDSLASAGATFIKVYTGLSRAQFDAIIAAARRRGLRVSGHVPVALTTEDALDAGVWTLEHAYRHRLACADAESTMREMLIRQAAARARRDIAASEALEDSTFRLGITTYSAARCQALGRRIARAGAWFVPTLVEARSRFLNEEPGDRAFDSLFAQPHLAALPPRMVTQWRDQLAFQAGLRAGMAATEEIWLAQQRLRAEEVATRLRMVADLRRGGARVLAGTDGSDEFPLVTSGYSIHEELQLLVQAGLTPLEALQAATLHAAEAVGQEHRFGVLAPGRAADVVLLEADPLEAIGHTRRIRAVVLGGRVFDEEALVSLRDRAAAAARLPGAR